MPRKPKNELGKRLRDLRQERGLSLRDVERGSGINTGYLSQLERGEVANPRPTVLQRIAEAYGEPVGVLMQWAGYVEPDPAGISPNAQRALSYLGDDFTDDELEALKSVLDAIRRRSATFARASRSDLNLSSEDRVLIRKHAVAVLRELGAADNSDPVDLDDVLVVAKLVKAGAIELTLEEKRTLRSRFGDLVDRAVDLLHGVVHLDSGHVYVKSDLHELRHRFVLSHEVGHAVLPDHRVVFAHLDDYRRVTPDFGDLLERQANQFSIDLLAKGDRLREEFDGSTPSVDRITEFSLRYSISLQATARRVAEESRQDLAIAIARRSHDGRGQVRAHRYRIWTSPSFEARFRWRAGRQPVDEIRNRLQLVGSSEPQPPAAFFDASGRITPFRSEPLDALYTVMVLFVPERVGRLRRFRSPLPTAEVSDVS